MTHGRACSVVVACERLYIMHTTEESARAFALAVHDEADVDKAVQLNREAREAREAGEATIAGEAKSETAWIGTHLEEHLWKAHEDVCTNPTTDVFYPIQPPDVGAIFAQYLFPCTALWVYRRPQRDLSNPLGIRSGEKLVTFSILPGTPGVRTGRK